MSSYFYPLCGALIGDAIGTYFKETQHHDYKSMLMAFSNAKDISSIGEMILV